MNYTINKKTTVQALLLAMLLLTAAACNKNYLDEPAPTQSVTEEAIFKSENGVRSHFNGIYSKMRQPWFPIGATAANSTDNWGYNAIILTRVNNGIDIINPGGWYQFDYRMENREPTYRRVIFTWQFFYETINQVNVIIKGVNASSSIGDAAKKKLIAEARALRGWFYFELAREFQFTIAKDPSAPGVPLYTEPTSVSNTGKPRGTLLEVFTLINEDLAYAVANLGTDRVYKSQVTLPVAQGMLARVMLEQKKWQEAANAAAAARQGFTLDAASYVNNYTNMEASPEVIWGFPQSISGVSQSLYYGTPSSFYEKTGNGYDNYYINSDLVNKFSATDIRNLFFLTNATPTNQRRFSTNKFGKASAFQVTLINGQTVPLKETDFEESLPMMRVAEMILVEAEARAELGQNEEARVLLLQLQKNRDPNAGSSGNSGQALINEILLERRKELYGELGIDYLDIKRRQLAYTRTGNHTAAYLFSFPANSKVFILKLPQREIDTNDAIGPTDQNQ
jgi:hypothetical protein